MVGAACYPCARVLRGILWSRERNALGQRPTRFHMVNCGDPRLLRPGRVNSVRNNDASLVVPVELNQVAIHTS